MKLKDRAMKKELLGLILESKTRSSSLISHLRNHDLSHLSNEVIA